MTIRSRHPWMGLALAACALTGRQVAAQSPAADASVETRDAAPVEAPSGGSPAPEPVEAFPPQPAEAASPDLPVIEEQLPPVRPGQRGPNPRRSRSTLDSVPYMIGDGGMLGTGGGAQGGGQLSLGRIVIEAPGLTGSPLTGASPAQLNLITDPSLNSVQAIANAGYPSFLLPSQPLGGVPGTPPTILTPVPASPAPGITGIGDPGGLYQAAAQNAFDNDPNLPGTNGGNGTAVYVQGASGALPSNPPNADPQDAFLFYDYVVDAGTAFPGYAGGLVKLAENMSPLPRDRVYMSYSYFHNANFGVQRADMNRFMPGFEKTFFDGWTSIELRTPFAATLDNVQGIGSSGAGTAYRDVEFGNMSLIFKTLLMERDTWAFTGGLQVMVPTAGDTFLYGATAATDEQIQQLYIANESVHVMPFVGSVWAPSERSFNQILLQIDADTNGNLAYVNTLQDPTARGRGLTQAGRLYYPTFMYLSFSTGYWLYKNDRATFTGFSPIFELHLNQAFDDFQPLLFENYRIGQNPGVISVTNALIGCNFEWGTRSTLSFAYVTPLGGGLDRFFDGELRAMYNWRFGPQNRLTRAQF